MNPQSIFSILCIVLAAVGAILAQPSLLNQTNEAPTLSLEETSMHELPATNKTETNNTTARPKKQAPSHDTMVEETIRLITDGDSIISLDKNHKDIVLVIGNTGAGKSTITKFIADVDSLESYDADDRYLIRDKDHKISVNSTIVSKTIFPELIIDNSTNTAFYDLPGFSDTRNASIEIANAWFMKKVADHAHRVKLLFIVNYFSLRTGETRLNFKTFLEHATELIRNPRKFNASIALVATKVEVNRSSAKIINGIASFLKTSKENLKEVFSDDSKLEAAEDLIDAFLSKDSDGNYNRISYFKQPEDEGPLTEFPEVMERKSHLENVLFNNINFTAKSSEDFGFSVSPTAKLLISKIAEKMNQRIAQVMLGIGRKLVADFQTAILSSPLESVGNLLQDQEELEKIATSLAFVKNREEFFRTLRQILTQLEMEDMMSKETAEMQQREDNLIFLEQISETKFPPSILDWSSPVLYSSESFRRSVQQKTANYSKYMKTRVVAVSQKINASFSAKLNQSESNEQKLKEFGRYTLHLSSMNDKLSRATSVNHFIQQLEENVGLLDVDVSPLGLKELTEDVQFDQRSPFQVWPWTAPLEKLLSKVRESMHNFQVQVLQEQNTEERRNHTETLETLKEEFERETQRQEERTGAMKREYQTAVDAIQNRVSEIQSNFREQMNTMQRMIEENNETIRQLQVDNDKGGIFGRTFRAVGRFLGVLA